MFPIKKVTPIVDLIIKVEKEKPIETLIDMNCMLANSGNYLKMYLSLKKKDLTTKQPEELKIIGTTTRNSPQKHEAAIYDQFIHGGLPEIISYVKKNTTDVLLLLDFAKEKLTSDTLIELLKYTQRGILLNLDNHLCDPSVNKLVEDFDEDSNNVFYVRNKQFLSKSLGNSLYYLKRMFQPHLPVFYFDIIENEDKTFVLKSEHSVLEYYVPDGSTYIGLKVGENEKNAELLISGDGKLLRSEPINASGTHHSTTFRLPANCSKITLNLNHQTAGDIEKVMLAEVAFS